MPGRIGIEDLKRRASEIVREVSEGEAEYVVTRRGEAVAELKPLSKRHTRELQRPEHEKALATLDALAEQIARAWRSSKGAVELIEELRR